jgi:MerR family transcriptional regulator, light-induced transcriptional regulator
MSTSVRDEVSSRFLEALVEGDLSACAGIVETLQSAGTPVFNIYKDLFQDSLYRVGQMWETNVVSVATEHLATAITETLMNRLFATLPLAERNRKRVIIGGVEHEYHQVGARMASDLFQMHGWDSYFLGGNVPRHDLEDLVLNKKPDLVGLSITQYFNMENLLKTIDQLYQRNKGIEIVIGGQGADRTATKVTAEFPDTKIIGNWDSLMTFIGGQEVRV